MCLKPRGVNDDYDTSLYSASPNKNKEGPSRTFLYRTIKDIDIENLEGLNNVLKEKTQRTRSHHALLYCNNDVASVEFDSSLMICLWNGDSIFFWYQYGDSFYLPNINSRFHLKWIFHIPTEIHIIHAVIVVLNSKGNINKKSYLKIKYMNSLVNFFLRYLLKVKKSKEIFYIKI